MRATLINDANIVVNVIEIDDDYEAPEGYKLGPGDGEIGWTWDSEAKMFTPSAAEPATVTAADYAAAVEAHVEAVARSRQYSGSVSLASYRDDPDPVFQAEASTFIRWRSTVWRYVIDAQGKVLRGERTPPTIQGLISELPVIEWPPA